MKRSTDRALYCAVLVACLAPASVWAQGDSAGARAAFERGSALSDEGEYARAIDAFRESHRLNPGNASPLYAIGVCQMELGEAHYAEAVATLDRYVADGHNPERHEDARHRIRTLLIALRQGTLRILAAPPAATIAIDGDTVPPGRYGRIRLAAGPHTVAATVSGRDDDTREVNIVAGELTQLSFAAPTHGGSPAPASDATPAAPVPEPVAADALAASEPGTTAPPEPVPDEAVEATPIDQEMTPREEQPVAQPRRGVHRQWWFWTIIGVVVAGGVAAGLGVGLSDPEPPGGDWRVEVP